MRILLISPNQEMLPDPVVPLGLAYLSSSLKAQRHEVQVLDLCFRENIAVALEQAVSQWQPEVLGLSLRNVDNVAYPATVSYLPFYKELVRKCRDLTSAPVFLGGSGFTLMPREILEYLGADGGVIGEGEETFPQILGDGKELSSHPLPGWVTPQDRSPIYPACISDLNSLPAPDWGNLNLTEYFNRGGMGSLQTKRGCPFTCIYCTYPLIEGRGIRLRSPEKVAQDAQSLVQRGIDNAFIVDNIFNHPERHAREVCRTLIERKIPLRWSCYAHPAYFSAPLAKEMKEAGCTGVEFGTDSGSPRVLAKLGKNFSPEDIRRANRLAIEAGLEVCHSLSLGAPGETEETLRETFDLMEEIAPTAVIAMIGLRIFPRTGLARLAVEEGLISPSHDFLPPVFYIAPNLKEKIIDLAKGEATTHPNWIFPGLGINVSVSLQAKLRRIGVKGPLWEHMKILRGRPAFRRGPHV